MHDYEGFSIGAYAKRITKSKEAMIHEISGWFSGEDWSVSTNSHSLTITYEPTMEKIAVNFKPPDYGFGKNEIMKNYSLVFESFVFGWRPHNERAHKKLCMEVMQRIPRKKQGFWCIDNVLVPIPHRKMLRGKR